MMANRIGRSTLLLIICPLLLTLTTYTPNAMAQTVPTKTPPKVTSTSPATNLQVAFEALKLEFDSLVTEYRLLKSDQKSEHEELKAQLTNVTVDNAALKSQLTKVNGDNAIVKAQLTQVNSQLTKINGDNAVVKAQLTKVNGDNVVVKAQLTKVNGDNVAVKAQLTKINGDNVAVNAQLTKIIIYNEAVKAQLTAFNIDNVAVKAQLTKIIIYNEAVKAQLKAINIDNVAVKAQLTKIIIYNEAVKAQLTAFNIDNVAVKAQLTKINIDNVAVKAQLTKVNSDNAVVKAQLTKVNGDNVVLKSQLTKINTEITARLDNIDIENKQTHTVLANIHNTTLKTASADLVAFCVGRSSLFKASGTERLPMNVEKYNVGGYFHRSDDSFHAPFRGVYTFFVSAEGILGPSGMRLYIYTKKTGQSKIAVANGAESFSNNGYGTVAVSVIVQMEKGETASVWVSGSTYSASTTATLFWGKLDKKL